ARSSSVSSESQPQPGSSRISRSCRKLSTAMSASLTGEPPCLLQLFGVVSKALTASAPASRTVASIAACSDAASGARNGQSLQPHRRGVGTIAEFKIVRRRERTEDVVEVSGDRHLADGVGQFAVL